MNEICEKMLCKTDKSSASSIEIKHLGKLNRDLQTSDDEGKLSGSANSSGNNIHDTKAQTAIHSPAWKTHDYHMEENGRENIYFLACWCEHVLLETFTKTPMWSCRRFPTCIEEMGIKEVS
jgi:hypothetical protein